MQALLSFDKAPPFPAPARFFLTAPVMGCLAGLLMLIMGPEVFASRWAPAALAATHLFTVGFFLQIMVGALIQVLPVVAGANLAHPLGLSRLVHGGLTLGVGLLVSAFLSLQTGFFVAAGVVLVVTLGGFLIAVAQALWGIASTSPTIRGLKLSLLGLAGTAILGGMLALGLAWGWALPFPVLADIHGAWGLAAWAGVLLAAVAYVVVPMFQLTPGYPARLSWWLPVGLFGLPLVWGGVAWGAPEWVRLVQGLLALVGALFAGWTLRLQRRRRRAKPDTTYRYWQGGLWCGLVAMVMLLVEACFPALSEGPAWSISFGIVLGIGALVSVMTGMLYKIVPFLTWFHLNNEGQGKGGAPTMNKVLPDRLMGRQMKAHFAALFLLLLAVWWPDYLSRLAGTALLVAQGLLLANLLGAFRLYRRHSREIAEKARASAPGAEAP